MRTIRENCDVGGLGDLSPTGPWSPAKELRTKVSRSPRIGRRPETLNGSYVIFEAVRCRLSAARRMTEGFVEKASAMSATVRRVGLFTPRSNWPM